MFALDGGEFLAGLFGHCPIQTTHQTLAILLPCKSAGSLLLELLKECGFNDEPIIEQVDVRFRHEGCFIPCPLVQAACCPSPLL